MSGRILKVWFTGNLFQTGVQLIRTFILNNWRYPALVNCNRVLLQQDNARPHTAQTKMRKFTELGGIKLLPHPAYNPDLAPSDYHLLRSMAHFLRGRNFENCEAMEVCLIEFFASKTRECYHCRVINLVERWLKTIESGGL